MRKILRQRAHRAAPGAAGNSTAPAPAAQRPRAASAETTRRNSASRPATDILSHLQELKDKERQVLGRSTRDAPPLTPGAAGSGTSKQQQQQQQQLSAEEAKSRQERLARDERLASQYREQLQTKLRDIHSNAVDLGYQKATMARFERRLLGSSSPRELEHLELERINGVRSLIGLPMLTRAPTLSGSVRQSRPGTPLYVASSPANIPSPSPHAPVHPPHHRLGGDVYRQQHGRTASLGDRVDYGSARYQHSHVNRTASGGSGGGGSESGVQDIDLDIEEGEISEEGELPG